MDVIHKQIQVRIQMTSEFENSNKTDNVKFEF